MNFVAILLHFYIGLSAVQVQASEMTDSAEITASPPEQQHFLTNFDSYRTLFSTCEIKGKTILEIGVGTGSLSKLILDESPEKLVGYEIDPTLKIEIDNPNFELILKDFTKMEETDQFDCFDGLISAPPYDLLEYIKNFISLHHIENVILMVPTKKLSLFTEYKTAFTLQGSDFEPAAKGLHHVIVKGFNYK